MPRRFGAGAAELSACGKAVVQAAMRESRSLLL
jgi:hypothetical protein